MTDKDAKYMSLALELAREGVGRVCPNPMVGAVIVKDDRIIGKGYHQQYGGPHAERNALASCTEDPEGAVLYVTLEPCCHHGKTPPCTDAIIESGIARVVVGAEDPNPRVAGGGISVLRKAGIDVETKVMEEECLALDPAFFKFISTGLPFVTMKYAMTLDGKIATKDGLSQWISSEEARRYTNSLRGHHMGIMVGSGTVVTDDPRLNCRTGGLSPVRIICDSSLETPMDSYVVRTASEEGSALRYPRTVIATISDNKSKIRQYEDAGVRILKTPYNKQGRVDLHYLMAALGDMGIESIMLEGGATMNWSALTEGIVDRAMAVISPKVFGGTGAKTPVSGVGVSKPEDCLKLKNMKTMVIGPDILIESEVIPCSQE